MRTFETGATRSDNDNKFDYEGFLSPLTLRRYAEYMHKHRKQENGEFRASDNWQKGIPIQQYMKSLFRHFMELWTMHRGWEVRDEIEEVLCAVLFNTFGYLHEYLKVRREMHVELLECSEEFCSECDAEDCEDRMAEPLTDGERENECCDNCEYKGYCSRINAALTADYWCPKYRKRGR